MTTKPHHDVASIIADGKHVAALAREDQSTADFKKRLAARELATFDANIAALQAGDGARSDTLHGQVAAGVHTATARAALLATLVDVRDDAKIQFREDEQLQHAFGVGALPASDSTGQVRELADEVLAAAESHPAEAKQLGLDTHGVHKLEDLVHALDGCDLAHRKAASGRHTNSTTTDSLAHLVLAETAHIRLVARRVFRKDEAKLSRYAPALPRHTVKHRAQPAVGH